MKYRSFVFALLSACCALWIAASAARAAPPSAAGLGVSSTPPLLIRVGHGCGWEYACPPEPGYGRPPAPRGNVYIHNNYGPVTVYRGDPSRPASRAPYGMECPGGDCAGTDSECGAFCWMRRIRGGYCGHGCWAYKEWQRLQAEEEARRAEEDREEEERERSEQRLRMYEQAQGCAASYCRRGDYGTGRASTPPSYYGEGYYSERRSYSEPPPEYRAQRPDVRYYRERDRSAPPPAGPRRRFEPPSYPPK